MLKVETAALRQRGNDARVFTGRSHADAMLAAAKCGTRPSECDEGFVLSDGSFVHRVAAMEAAKDAVQVRPEYAENEVLFSYMLK